MASFASRLKMLRERVGMTQQELADKLGLSVSAIGMYETEGRNPSREVSLAAADFFNVDLDYLLGRSDFTTLIVPGDVAGGYYLDTEIKMIANAVAKDDNLKMLFKNASKATPEGVKLAADMLKEMKRKEDGDGFDGIDEIRDEDDPGR